MKRKVFFGLLVAGWVVIGALGADVNPAQAGRVAVPVPSTIPLLGLGLALLGWSRHKNK